MHGLTEQSLRNHFFALVRRKDAIESEIQDELQRPQPCSLLLQKLKRQRLKLKDRMRAIGYTTQAA